MSSSQHLEYELQALRQLLMAMTDLVDAQLADAMNALLEDDAPLADAVIERDHRVDALEIRIDQQCERLLARFAPVAVDLRLLVIAVKVNTDLERIGDHCRNLARNTHHLSPLANPLRKTPIPEMADLSRTMLRDVQRAFLEHDRVLARKVVARDMRVNRLHRKAFEQLVSLAEAREYVEATAHLITAIKALERIADHVKNVANHVIFLVEGVDQRHPKLRSASSQ
jgi:phosphate transport system protein